MLGGQKWRWDCVESACTQLINHIDLVARKLCCGVLVFLLVILRRRMCKKNTKLEFRLALDDDMNVNIRRNYFGKQARKHLRVWLCLCPRPASHSPPLITLYTTRRVHRIEITIKYLWFHSHLIFLNFLFIFLSPFVLFTCVFSLSYAPEFPLNFPPSQIAERNHHSHSENAETRKPKCENNIFFLWV